MAETTAAFQADAFGFGFDTFDIPPVLFKVAVEPPSRIIQQGQTATITIYVIDNSSTPGKKYPFTLITAPSITLYAPDNTVYQASALMRQIGDGIYSYTKPTTGDITVGPYSASFTAVNGTSEMATEKHVVFTVI